MKNIKAVICIAIIIVCLISGFLGGYYFDSMNYSKNTIPNKNATVIKDETANETKFPFELYQSFLSSSGAEIIEKINNNPIDKAYFDNYTKITSPIEEQAVLVEWNNAYEKEFENAKSILENALKLNDVKNINVSICEILNNYYDNSIAFEESASSLAYYFEEYNLGHGTDHVYDLLYNSLELKRENTFRIIECIYLINGNYEWTIEQ